MTTLTALSITRITRARRKTEQRRSPILRYTTSYKLSQQHVALLTRAAHRQRKSFFRFLLQSALSAARTTGRKTTHHSH